MKNGLFEEYGELVYYKEGTPYHAGVIEQNGDIYYIGRGGRAVRGEHTVHSSMTNGILERGKYIFGKDYKLIPKENTDKNGLFEEDGELIYYENDLPSHAGIVQIGDDIYYISSEGLAIRGTHYIHKNMAHGIVKRGTYTFGDDYKLIEDSYIPPKKSDKKKKKKHISKRKTKKAAKKIITIVSIAIVASIILGGVYMWNTGIFIRLDRRKLAEERRIAALSVEMPKFEDEILLCSAAAKRAYDGEISVKQALSDGDPYRAFEFKYKLLDKDGKLYISEKADMSDAMEFDLSAKKTSLTIDNLKTGTIYRYKAVVGVDEYTGYFATAQSTRFINMPGVKNTRDIGGYTTLDGKRVKQGMLIRGSEIDGLVQPTYFLNKEAYKPLKDALGFVCDLDLREKSLFNGTYQSMLGENVAHKFYNSPMYGSTFNAGFRPALKQIFADLANPDNYPMYLHCTYGADRTGTVCFLLEGILNLPEEVMQRDYQLTGYFMKSYANSRSFNSIYGGLEGYKGKNIQQKIVNYLVTEIGVTPAQIESIREIFLED